MSIGRVAALLLTAFWITATLAGEPAAPPASPPPPPDDPDLIPIEVIEKAYNVLDKEAQRSFSSLTETPDHNRGIERVPFATFEIDSARPSNRFELRMDIADDFERPDRSEYFWAKIGGKGPTTEVSPGVDPAADFQELLFLMEKATGFASALVEIPIRILDPALSTDPLVLDNTAGLGDIRIGVKTRLFEVEKSEISMIFRTYIPSGLARRGLGVGHVSLEPGVLANYMVSNETFLHGEVKFWFPIAGDADYQGRVLRYGVGISHVLYSKSMVDTCPGYFSIIPTLEIVGWSALDGMETGIGGFAQNVDGIGVINLQPGVRFVLTERIEFGYSMAVAVSDHHWYRNLHRFSLRWYY